MGKRGNGEGSIYRTKTGLWRGAYTVHTAEGVKRRFVSGKTRAEAARKLAEGTAARDKGLVFDAGSLTLGAHLDRWLEDSVRGTVRQRTWERYEQIARVHIKPVLGRVKLKTLSPAQVRGLYAEKREAGLSPRTCNYVHVTLRKALSQAVADGLVPRNVADAVKAPRPGRKEVQALSPEQARTLLDAARGDRFEALFVVAVHCGLRQGELLGLKWDDLDLESGALRVRCTLSETRTGRVFEPPKNGKGRSVELTPRAIRALKEHLERQLDEVERVGDFYSDHGLVFPNTTGNPMQGKNLTMRCFKPLLKWAGLPDVRFHDLRHTFATLMLKNGEHPKVVQEMLGHATIAITMDTYSQVLPNMQREAAARLGSLLG